MSLSKLANDPEDYLEVDNPIPGQNYCCLSFLTPDKLLKKKELYYISEFVKYLVKPTDMKENPNKNKLEELVSADHTYAGVENAYKDFLYTNEKTLQDQFSEQHNFQTSVSGVKIRGIYDTRREAEVRSKLLQKKDPNFNVFVGQVGYWLPYDPNPEHIADQEYNETQLNNLAKEYNKNRESVDILYEQTKREKIQKAREDASRNKTSEQHVEISTEETKKNLDEMREIANLKEAVKLVQPSEQDAKSGQSAEPSPTETDPDAVSVPLVDKLLGDDVWLSRHQP